MRKRHGFHRHGCAGTARSRLVTHRRPPFGNSNLCVANCCRVRSMHADGERSALWGVRSVQAAQPIEAALGFLALRGFANSAPFTFRLRFIQARRKPMAPSHACLRVDSRSRSQRHSVTLCSDGIIAIKRNGPAGVAQRSQSSGNFLVRRLRGQRL